MTNAQAEKLACGLYEINWKSGGSSLAAVGSDRAGRRWHAPTNWTGVPSFDWRPVASVKPLAHREKSDDLLRRALAALELLAIGDPSARAALTDVHRRIVRYAP